MTAPVPTFHSSSCASGLGLGASANWIFSGSSISRISSGPCPCWTLSGPCSSWSCLSPCTNWLCSGSGVSWPNHLPMPAGPACFLHQLVLLRVLHQLTNSACVPVSAASTLTLPPAGPAPALASAGSLLASAPAGLTSAESPPVHTLAGVVLAAPAWAPVSPVLATTGGALAALCVEVRFAPIEAGAFLEARWFDLVPLSNTRGWGTWGR